MLLAQTLHSLLKIAFSGFDIAVFNQLSELLNAQPDG